jgi:hypothetical protein
VESCGGGSPTTPTLAAIVGSRDGTIDDLPVQTLSRGDSNDDGWNGRRQCLERWIGGLFVYDGRGRRRPCGRNHDDDDAIDDAAFRTGQGFESHLVPQQQHRHYYYHHHYY